MLFLKKIPLHLNEPTRLALEKLGVYKFASIKKGELKLAYTSNFRIRKVLSLLEDNGFSFTTNKKEILSEKIKSVVSQMLCNEQLPVLNVSVHIAKELGHNYTYLSNMFSQFNGLTIEQYIIRCRVAKAKKLMRETDASIGSIAKVLHYSSVSHFSTQFKKVTGATPSEYKNRIIAGEEKDDQ